MAGFAWNAGDASALASLYQTGGADNFGKYSNPVVDGLFNAASATLDHQQRVSAFARAQQILVDNDAIAYLSGQAPDLVASTKSVRGLDEYAVNGMWLWDQIWLKAP